MKKPFFAALVVAPILGAPVQAQGPKPAPPPPVGAEPQSTSAAFGDWTLRCQRVAESDKVLKICEVVGAVRNQNQETVAQAIIGRALKNDPLKLAAQIPDNVTIPSVVKFAPEGKEAKPWELALRRVTPIGVFAELVLSDAQIVTLHAPAEAGSLEFTDAVGRPVKLPLSLRGLPQALDALAKE